MIPHFQRHFYYGMNHVVFKVALSVAVGGDLSSDASGAEAAPRLLSYWHDQHVGGAETPNTLHRCSDRFETAHLQEARPS